MEQAYKLFIVFQHDGCFPLMRKLWINLIHCLRLNYRDIIWVLEYNNCMKLQPTRWVWTNKICMKKLDRLQIQAFRFADKNCRKLRMGKVPFSPDDVQIEGRRISLWTLVIRRKVGYHVGTKTTKRLAKKCEIKKTYNMTSKQQNNFGLRQELGMKKQNQMPIPYEING